MKSKTISEPIYDHWSQARVNMEIDEREKSIINFMVQNFCKNSQFDPNSPLTISLTYPKEISYSNTVIGKINTITNDKEYIINYSFL